MMRIFVSLAILLLVQHVSRAQSYEAVLIDLDGLKVLMDKKDDTTRVFNFWATWCMPCVRELPYLDSFYRTSLRPNEKLYLVSLDDAKKARAKVNGFVKRKNLAGPVWLLDEDNPNEFIDAIDPTWIGSIPATLVIRGGKRCFKEHEFQSVNEIREWIDNCVSFEK